MKLRGTVCWTLYKCPANCLQSRRALFQSYIININQIGSMFLKAVIGGSEIFVDDVCADFLTIQVNNISKTTFQTCWTVDIEFFTTSSIDMVRQFESFCCSMVVRCKHQVDLCSVNSQYRRNPRHTAAVHVRLIGHGWRTIICYLHTQWMRHV